MEIFSEIRPGFNYAGYVPHLGHYSALDVAVAFLKSFGHQPEQVLWCKPGMWMAGPVEIKPATASAVEANAIAEAPAVEAQEPADSVMPTGPDGQTEPMQLSFIQEAMNARFPSPAHV